MVEGGLGAAAGDAVGREARDMVPLMLAVTPQGLTLGLALGQLPTGRRAAWSTSGLIYSGSAQLALVSGYAGGAGLTAVLVALVINARLLFYGAAMAPLWQDRPLRWRVLAGHLLIDPSFAHAQDRQNRPGTPAEKACTTWAARCCCSPAAAGTLALRLAFLVGGRYRTLLPWSRRISDLVFPVAIAAIRGATLRTEAATGRVCDLVALAAGAVVTLLVSRRTKSILYAMGAGLRLRRHVAGRTRRKLIAI